MCCARSSIRASRPRETGRHGRSVARPGRAAHWRGRVALAAPLFAPNSPTTQFEDRAYAPPTRIHIRDADGFRSPFVYRMKLENRLARRYAEDTSAPVSLKWFSGGRILSTADAGAPLLLLGGDALGRDVLSRLLCGARWSLGVTAIGVLGALLFGALVGGLAGTVGGRADAALMGVSDFLLALPGAYLVLVLRGALPLVITTGETFVLMAALFAFAAWPHVARGVRGIVSVERARDYAEAARATGAGPWRLMTATAAGRPRVSRRRDRAARAGAARRGSDGVVSRSRISRRGRQLGHDAAGRGERARDERGAVDARAGRRCVRRRARGAVFGSRPASRMFDTRAVRPIAFCAMPRCPGRDLSADSHDLRSATGDVDARAIAANVAR